MTSSSVAVDTSTGIAYYGTPDALVYAVNIVTEHEVWHTRIGDPAHGAYIWSSPLLANGMVYIGLASQNDNPCVRGGVFALNPWSGKVVWVHYAAVAGVVGGGVWSSVTAVPELHAIIATTGNPCTEHTPTYQEDSIVGLDWTTGATLWSYNAVAYDDCGCELGEGAVDVTLNGEHYFIAGNKFGSVYALKLQGKGVKLVWSRRVATIDSSSRKLFGGIFEPPAYSDGNVFVAGGATLDGKCVGTLSSMRATTGAVNWSICTSSRTFSPAASSGGSLFVGGSNIVTGYDNGHGPGSLAGACGRRNLGGHRHLTRVPGDRDVQRQSVLLQPERWGALTRTGAARDTRPDAGHARLPRRQRMGRDGARWSEMERDGARWSEMERVRSRNQQSANDDMPQ